MTKETNVVDLIGYDHGDVERVPMRADYGVFQDIDDGDEVAVSRHRAAVVVMGVGAGSTRGVSLVNLSGLDAAKLSGALTAAAIDALTWEEQNR